MTIGDELIRAIHELGARCRRDFGEDLHEVWVGPRAYDTMSYSIMTVCGAAVDAEDPRGKWANGLIELHHAGGMTLIRRAVK
jgi:hypothetical protein